MTTKISCNSSATTNDMRRLMMELCGNMLQATELHAKVRRRGKFCTVAERLDKETLDKLRRLRDSLR